MALAIVKRTRPGAGLVGFGATVDLFGLIESLTPLPELHHKGIPGLRHGARAPVPRHKQRIFIHPRHTLFGPRQHEPAFDELAELEVELAHDDGIFTSRGERDEAQLISRIETPEALLNPSFVVLFSQRIVVQYGLPMRLRSQIV